MGFEERHPRSVDEHPGSDRSGRHDFAYRGALRDQEGRDEGRRTVQLGAHAHEDMFKDYNWDAEGRIIRAMSPKYGAFVNDKPKSIHADPWLVAQAKHRGLTGISEEKRVGSANPKNHKLPNVCADPVFAVPCIDLLGLTKVQGWKFR